MAKAPKTFTSSRKHEGPQRHFGTRMTRGSRVQIKDSVLRLRGKIIAISEKVATVKTDDGLIYDQWIARLELVPPWE